MYMNEALLSWYRRLHVSKVPDLDYSRAKMFLHNRYLCFVVVQCLCPPVIFGLVGNFYLGIVLFGHHCATLPLCFICYLIEPLFS